MSNRFDLITGKDVQSSDGTVKTYWTRVGTMFESKNNTGGYSIKLDAYPLPDAQGNVWIKAVVPKDKNGGEPVVKNGPRASLSEELNDGIPFEMEWR